MRSPAGGDDGEDPRPPLWFLIPVLLGLWGVLMCLAILPFAMDDKPRAWGLISTALFFMTFFAAAAITNFIWFRIIPRDRIRQGFGAFSAAADHMAARMDEGLSGLGVPLAVRAAFVGHLAALMFWGAVAALTVLAILAMAGAAGLFS